MSEPSTRSLRPAKVAQKLDVSLPTLWRYVKQNPNFPRPYKLSPRVTLFHEGEVERFLSSLRTGALDSPGSLASQPEERK